MRRPAVAAALALAWTNGEATTQTSREPRVVERAEQPYVAIALHIARGEIPKANEEVFGWLAARGHPGGTRR